jgi:hypothetical protein
MLVSYIFDVNPFKLKVSFKFSMLIFPPKRKGLLMISRNQTSNTLEMPTFHGTKEQISVNFIFQVVSPILVKLIFVSVGRCPNAIFYGFVDVIIVTASDHNASAWPRCKIAFLSQRLKMRDGFDNRRKGLVVGT